jgi:thymidine kinase
VRYVFDFAKYHRLSKMSERVASAPPPRSGTLHLIVGCMYSGKTDELLKQIRLRRLSGKRVLLIQQGGGSHNGIGAVSRADLLDSDFVPINVDCVAIDEGQLFDGIEEFVRILTVAGKTRPHARFARIGLLK